MNNDNQEEQKILIARKNITKYHHKIRDFEILISQYKDLIKREYEVIRQTCQHNWVRERERCMYGETYTVCTKCRLLYS